MAIDLYWDQSPEVWPGILYPIARPDLFVVADAHFLPFRSDVFEDVFCIHTLEHCEDPGLVVWDLCRVSKAFVHIEVPHRYSRRAKNPYHRSFFNVKWFQALARAFDIYIDRHLIAITPTLPLPFGNLFVVYNVRRRYLPEDHPSILQKLTYLIK